MARRRIFFKAAMVGCFFEKEEKSFHNNSPRRYSDGM
jgi:hypothetical protein